MQTATEFEVMPPVTDIGTPNLTAEESAELLDCINAVRAGEEHYLVLLTNHKVTETPKRLPDRDYDPVKALAPHAHLGWMSRAPTNKRGEVYIYVFDEARALAGENGHTCITMQGIHSFKVLNSRPGPEATARIEAARLERRTQPEPEPLAPSELIAQAMYHSAQAQALMAQALLAQAPAQKKGG